MTSSVYQENPKELDGVPDLCQLLYLAEPNVLHNLQHRYTSRKIYTSTTAKVLVAVNPYEYLPGSDSDETMAKYHAADINLEGLLTANSLDPNVFTVAHAAYHNLVAKNVNQSVIVCGESGSGKTESAKLFMKFLAYTSTVTSSEPKEFTEAKSVGNQVLDANPILESFGNAKTVLNNNSSRFGKFTKMIFQPRADGNSNRLVGAAIETYLLEKSRVVRQDVGERNYHIFYYICSQAAAHPEWLLGNGNADDFHYLNQSGCTTFDGDSASDSKDFNVLVQAMNTLCFESSEQKEVFATIAGILHLGNVQFESHGETCKIVNTDSLLKCAKTFQVESTKLEERLTTRTIYVMGKSIVKPLTVADAESNRDSIAKALFNGLFLWVVQRINKQSMPNESAGISWIGTLDVFGFEIFQNNSFEQLCINFANERLQSFFNHHVLKAEQELYKREALIWTHVDLPENQDVIDLIVERPAGVFAVLDSACLQPQGSHETFTHNLFAANTNHARLSQVIRSPSKKKRGFTAMNGFSINHYAGTVIYNAQDFLVKNNDSTHPDTCSLFNSSKLNVVSVLLCPGVRTGHQEKRNSMTFSSVSSVFSKQLETLMQTLKATQPYFVRCIKPNEDKKPRHFVPEYVQPQLRCGGLIQALRIIKCGFPTRCSYKRIAERFSSILTSFGTPHNLNKRDFAEAIITFCGGTESLDKSQYQLGLTMIFFRPGKQAFFQNILEIKPEDISQSVRQEIHRFLIKKRIIRMCGSIRAYVRLHHFRHWLRIAKAARVMSIIGKTMFRTLRRVRRRLNSKFEEEERRKMMQNQKYLDALAAQEQLKAMKAAEAQWKQKLLLEKENAKNAINELESTRDTMQSLMEKQKENKTRIAQLESENSQCKADYDALTENLRQGRLESQQLAEQVEAFKIQRSKDSSEFSQGLAIVNQEKKKLLDDNKALRVSIDKELAIKSSELSALQQRLQDATNRAKMSDAEAQQSLEEMEARKDNLQRQIQQIQEENRRLAQKLDDATAKMDRERNTNNLSQNQLQQDLSVAQDNLQKIQNEFNQQNQEFHRMESTLKHELASLEASFEQKEQGFKNQKTQFEAHIQALTFENNELKASFENLKKKYDSAKQQASDRECELENEARALKSQHLEAQESLNRQLQQMEAAFSEESTKFLLLQKQYESMEQQASSKSLSSAAELKVCKEKIHELKQIIEGTRRQFDEDLDKEQRKSKGLNEQNQQLEETIVSMKHQEQKLQHDLRCQQDLHNHNSESLNRKLAEQLEEMQTLATAKSKLLVQLDQIQASHHAAELKLKHKNEELASQLASIGEQLATEREDNQDSMKKLKSELRRTQAVSQDDFDSKINSLNKKNQAFKNELLAKTQKIEITSQELRRSQIATEEAKSELDLAQQQLASIASKLEERESSAQDAARKAKAQLQDSEDREAVAQQNIKDAATKALALQATIDEQHNNFHVKIALEQEIRKKSEQEVSRLRAELEISNERLEVYQRSHEENVHQLDSQLEAEKANTRALKTMCEEEVRMLKKNSEFQLESARRQWDAQKAQLAEQAQTTLAEHIREFNNQKQAFRRQLAQYQFSESDSTTRMESMKADIKFLQERMQAKDNMLQGMEKVLNEQKIASAEAIQNLKSQYAQIAAAAHDAQQTEKQQLKSSLDAQKHDLKAINDTRSKLFCQNLQLQKQNEHLSKLLETQKAHGERVQSVLLEQHKVQLQSQQRKYERRIAQFEKKVEELLQDMAEQEQNVQILAPAHVPLNVSEMSSRNDDFVAKVDVLIAEQQGAWSEKAENYDAMVSDLRQKLQNLSGDSRLTSEHFETEKAKWEIEKNQLAADFRVERLRADEASRTTEAELRAEIRKLQAKNNRLQEQRIELATSPLCESDLNIMSPSSQFQKYSSPLSKSPFASPTMKRQSPASTPNNSLYTVSEIVSPLSATKFVR